MEHEQFMQRAIQIAQKGWPAASPNPLVGCVITQNGKIVSEGFHEKFGQPHAEVNAIINLYPSFNPADCTLYVTLEPCAHQGKTPPCADLLIEKGFKTVVIAGKDPNPLVAGKGIEKLKKAGINVVTGVLEKEARELNKIFLCFHENKRPYLILKWAISADGFISRLPRPANREDNKITRKEADLMVHQLRSEVQGIFVGKNTVLNDNPLLTTRLVKGPNPVRIFLDKNLEVPADFNIYNNDARTIVFNNIKDQEEGHKTMIRLNFNENVLPQVLKKLYEMGLQSVLVEGGSTLINELVNQDLWDEVLIFQNPELVFNDGVKAPVFPVKNTFELIGDDKLFRTFKNETLPAKGPLSKEIF